MNFKKCFILAVTLLTFLIGLNTTLWGQEQKDPNDKIKVLQEKIKQLESVVRHTENEKAAVVRKLDEQIKENERLKNLCSQSGIDTSPQKDKKPSKVEDPNMSNVSPLQLYRFAEGPLTELQKKEFYDNNYNGKQIQWTGIVSSVDSEMGHKKDKESYHIVTFLYYFPHDYQRGPVRGGFQGGAMSGYDYPVKVRVEFPESQKQKLISLNTGSLVTYQAKLPDNYRSWMGLTDGIIISVKPAR
jgi:hypothetical protein